MVILNMEKYSILLKCISFLYILTGTISQTLPTEKNLTDFANQKIITQMNLTGINLTKDGIYIDNIVINSTIFLSGRKLIEEEIPEKKNSTAHKFRLITRDEWSAQSPQHKLYDLELPSIRVIIAHTATEGCTSQAECTFRVRFIQTFHIESRGWDDIAYNFLVGGDGAVYEGRGWDKQGAHTKGYNVKSICIAFIGQFNKINPSEGQLNAAKLLIQEGLKLGKISNDYTLYGHRQLIPTESPGDVLYEIIKTWPQYSTTT